MDGKNISARQGDFERCWGFPLLLIGFCSSIWVSLRSLSRREKGWPSWEAPWRGNWRTSENQSGPETQQHAWLQGRWAKESWGSTTHGPPQPPIPLQERTQSFSLFLDRMSRTQRRTPPIYLCPPPSNTLRWGRTATWPEESLPQVRGTQEPHQDFSNCAVPQNHSEGLLKI